MIHLLESLIFLIVIMATTKGLGLYLFNVLEGKKTYAPERFFYTILRIDPKKEQSWQEYSVSLIIFSLLATFFTFIILRIQNILPLNPQNFASVKADLAFNTAASFVTNTNWQSYGGEYTLSYFSQMVALTFQNFASAAVGIAVAAALVRGISRKEASTLGNFWVTFIRSTLYLFLPLAFIFSIFLISQGVIQNFKPTQITEYQSVIQGPIASQVAIKVLGTNGGGYTNVNAAHPFENPTPLSNFFQMIAMFIIPTAMTYYFGKMIENTKHGWSLWLAMMILVFMGLIVVAFFEMRGNDQLRALGLFGGNMEGKEMRFGPFDSSFFATLSTNTSCGAVNSMHDSYTPLGGLVLLVNLMIGCLGFGGVGSGLFSILIYVLLAVFLAGLMTGRTPEYLGKKIEGFEIKASVLFLMIALVGTLGLSSWAITSSWGLKGLENSGPHGLSEILYAYASSFANNGSAFAGLSTDTTWYNTTLGLSMLFGRYFMMIPILAIAGSLAKKKKSPLGENSFPVSGGLFVVLLIATIFIVGALVFFPAITLGPLLEFLNG